MYMDKEIEKAISHFKRVIAGLKYLVRNAKNKRRLEASRAALTALCEQSDRNRGCDACGLIYKLDGASYGTTDEIIDNRYCPMCGKKVEVEK